MIQTEIRNSRLYQKVLGCLLGGLIGDAMGAPVECWDYKRIIAEFGEIVDFSGEGTDDSLIKAVLCKAIIENEGYVTADEFAQSFLKNITKEGGFDLLFIPVQNMYHKIQDDVCLPVDAGYGNMHSSSSAMAISPMGIINASNPRQAALEAYEVAGLIHSGPAAFCRDAASAMAAAVAEAFSPAATVQSILKASTAYLHRKSSKAMINAIENTLAMACECADYQKFRETFYQSGLKMSLQCDSRETVPCALALFYLANGDPVKCIQYSANFGRDSDTIGTMAGALAGAFKGVKELRPEWVAKIGKNGEAQGKLAERLAGIAVMRINHLKDVITGFDQLQKTCQ